MAYSENINNHKLAKNIPNLNKNPLLYIFEDIKLKNKENTIWLEFGVQTGSTINKISKFTKKKVYGFDTFTGLPEDWRKGFLKGSLTNNGVLPEVGNNVVLIKGLFQETLINFLEENCINKKISFVHMDADLYSSTKYVLDHIEKYLDNECYFVFDELINVPGLHYDNSEIRALDEFLNENKK